MQCPRLVWTTFIPRVRTYASRMEWTGALPYSIQLALCMPVCANQAKPSIESISSFVLSSGRQEEKQRIWGIHALPCRACDFSNICRPHTHFRDEKKDKPKSRDPSDQSLSEESHSQTSFPNVAHEKNSEKRFFHPSIHPLLSIAAQESRKCQRNFACKTDEKTTMCTHDLLCGSTRRSCLPNLR